MASIWDTGRRPGEAGSTEDRMSALWNSASARRKEFTPAAAPTAKGGPGSEPDLFSPPAGFSTRSGQPRGGEPDLPSPAGFATRAGTPAPDGAPRDPFATRRAGSRTDEDVFTSYRRPGGAEPPPESTARASLEGARAAALHFENGLGLLRSGANEEALAEWELATSLDPENRVYQSNLKRLKRKLGETRQP